MARGALSAAPPAPCWVVAFCVPAWVPLDPRRPAGQAWLPLGGCCCGWVWFVVALLFTFVVAVEPAVCVAELGPELTLPPAIETGTLALTACCLLCGTPTASCFVSAFCPPIWAAPVPPQPARQEPLPPAVCCCDWVWFVVAVLPTLAVAAELAVWFAELGPELTLPPAIETGTLAFAAVCWLPANAIEPCCVLAFGRP